jgi:hypothetical protein
MTAASRRTRLVHTASTERIIAAPVTTRAAVRKAAASVGGVAKSSIPVHKSHVVQKRGFVPSTPGQTPKMPAKTARTANELLPEAAYSPQPTTADELTESSSIASHELFATPASARLGPDGLPMALAGVSATPRHDDDVVEDGMRRLNVSGLAAGTATPEPNTISVDAPVPTPASAAPASATKLTPRNTIPVRRSGGCVRLILVLCVFRMNRRCCGVQGAESNVNAEEERAAKVAVKRRVQFTKTALTVCFARVCVRVCVRSFVWRFSCLRKGR